MMGDVYKTRVIDVPVSVKNIYNWAAKEAIGKYLVFLPSQTSLYESGLSSPIFQFLQFEAMFRAMESNANIGIIGSTTAYQHGTYAKTMILNGT
jgi:hypothetical protein